MIHRDDHIDNFTVVSNDLAHDARLSWEARGFLVYLLSLPDDWNFNIKGLVSQTGTKKDVILRLVKELKEAGYISIKQETGKRGVFTVKTWEIYEDCTVVGNDRTRQTPNTVKTEHGENRTRETPNTVLTEYGETRLIQNTNIELNTNSNKVLNIQSTKEKTKKREKRFVPPTLEDIRAYCQERNSSVDPVKFYEYFTVGNWKDSKGNPVKNWKQKLITWEKMNPPAHKAQTLPTSSNPFTELKRREGLI